jgi:hypothetical protein
MSHAAATSFIHIVVFAANQVNHSRRKTGSDSGPKGEEDAEDACTTKGGT